MDSDIQFHLILAVMSVSFTISTAQGGSCNACNCQFDTSLKALDQLIESKIALNPAAGFGVTYTRWGKSSCPSSTGSQLVYSGRAGGTNYNSQGGAAERICLPDDPDYQPETSGLSINHFSTVQGVEYELFFGPTANITQHNTPCAVCDVPTRNRAIMIPAKTMCPSSWTREYYGYLTTERETNHRSSYTCLDNSPDIIAGTSENEDPSLLYYTITDCNGLSCPPYERNRILSCAVCTK